MQRPGRILPGVELQLAAYQGHQPLGVGLIVDRERGGVAEALRLPAQDADARGMERHDPHGPGTRADQHGHPRCHLAGRLVGEGDGQDLARQDVPRGEQVGDPVGQHPGLPGPRARHDEQRAARVDHRSPLLRVQPVQKGISSRSGHPNSLGVPADSRTPFREPRNGPREAVHHGGDDYWPVPARYRSFPLGRMPRLFAGPFGSNNPVGGAGHSYGSTAHTALPWPSIGLHPHTLLSASTICSPRPLSLAQSGCRGAGASSLASMTASMTSPARRSRHSLSTAPAADPGGRGIPALGKPALAFAASARWLAQADRVRG